MNYLIEVTCDSNDTDYVSENYIGTNKDLDDVRTMLSYLKLFYDKYVELYHELFQHHHGDMLEELDKCFYVLQGGKIIQIKHKEFLTFVKDNLEKAKFLYDWVCEYWVSDSNELCHTLISIKAYELKNINPLILYKEE